MGTIRALPRKSAVVACRAPVISYLPVLPNPPLPRSLGASSLVSSMRGDAELMSAWDRWSRVNAAIRVRGLTPNRPRPASHPAAAEQRPTA